MIWLWLAGCSPSVPEDPRWVHLEGGTFMMGNPDVGGEGMQGGEPITRIRSREKPVHEVTVPDFELMRHEVRIDTYLECLAAGKCAKRNKDRLCVKGRKPDLPANCLDWHQATQVCAFLGARLPTEAEWEYAATSGGKGGSYPWGDAPPDCSRANIRYGGEPSCHGDRGPWSVCTHPEGNTPSGLCEMGGNLFEWTQDDFEPTYASHPRDGSPTVSKTPQFKAMRGGGIGSDLSPLSRQRTFHPASFQYPGMGVRCAR